MEDVYMCCDAPRARPGMKFCGSCGTKIEDYMLPSSPKAPAEDSYVEDRGGAYEDESDMGQDSDVENCGGLYEDDSEMDEIDSVAPDVDDTGITTTVPTLSRIFSSTNPFHNIGTSQDPVAPHQESETVDSVGQLPSWPQRHPGSGNTTNPFDSVLDTRSGGYNPAISVSTSTMGSDSTGTRPRHAFDTSSLETDEGSQHEAMLLARVHQSVGLLPAFGGSLRVLNGGVVACQMCGYDCLPTDQSCPDCDCPLQGGTPAESSADATTTHTPTAGDDVVPRTPNTDDDVAMTLYHRAISTLVGKPWYGGPLGRVAAEARVAALGVGGFVVRQQLQTPGSVAPRPGFVLTVKGPDKCRHYRLGELKGRWHVESDTAAPMFTTVAELLNYYSMTTLLGGVALSVPEEFSTDVSTNTNGSHLAAVLENPPPPPPPSSDDQRQMAALAHAGSSQVNDAAEELHVVAELKQLQLQEALHSKQRSRAGRQESETYCRLFEATRHEEKLPQLISIGNDILIAERDNKLLDGELAKLRQAYRIRRGILAYGCLRTSWQPNSSAPTCQQKDCDVKFKGMHRRHHCRCCGGVMCKAHSSLKFDKAGLRLQRVCPVCYFFLNQVSKGFVQEALKTYKDPVAS
eukprot:m.35258 g.35258  ORF g.35258 m.35258 type:complete len:630 (+) comp14396_c0_seq1:176-2065(+)